MEPEEIDKLFKDRLAGLPAMPSADAWQRLQQKMEPPKKERSMWIYYAAASVVILLVSGLLIINFETQKPGIATNSGREAKFPPAQNNNPFIIKENSNRTIIADQSINDKNVLEKNNTNNNQPEVFVQRKLVASNAKETKGNYKVKTPKASNKSTFLADLPTDKKSNTTPDADYKMDNANTAASNAPDTFTLANNSQSPPETALMATIVEVTVKKNYTDDANEDDNSLRENLTKKTLLLKNIYKQARNLKNGDPVELTALGVDTDKLQAETKEIKQKINKVISL